MASEDVDSMMNGSVNESGTMDLDHCESPRFQSKKSVDDSSVEVNCERRLSLRPRNRSNSETSATGRVKKNLEKQNSKSNGCLETIYEDPIVKNGQMVLTGLRKLKRSITFTPREKSTGFDKRGISKRKYRCNSLLGKAIQKKIAELRKRKNFKGMSIADIQSKLDSLNIDESLLD